jgi:hypothetical protein
MGWKWVFAAVAALLMVSCSGEDAAPVLAGEKAGYSAQTREAPVVQDSPMDIAALDDALEELAELERSGGFARGMGLAESSLREKAADYAGAVAAAYKELAWAYGSGFIGGEALEEGLGNVLALDDGGMATVRTAEGILAFKRGQWEEAAGILGSLFDGRKEPDGFAQWMILVCALEKSREDRQAGAAYRAIRSRYALFPEYWYRGARAFTGAIGAEYAERCIGLAPGGPFAGECRDILAVFAGLAREDGVFLKSRFEIEELISRSLSQGNPESLAPLVPLMSLPDNPYTIYALGALRALAAVPVFRDYFSGLAASSGGRLAERFAYISRG